MNRDMERYSSATYTSLETASVEGRAQQAHRSGTTEGRLSLGEEQGNWIHNPEQALFREASGEMHETQRGGENAAPKKGHGASAMERAAGMTSAVLSTQKARMRAALGSLTNGDGQHAAIYIFFCVACVHLLFVILSSTLSQLDLQGGSCYTFWGHKDDCDRVSYTTRTSLMMNCSQLRSSLQAGAAFSILSILASVATATASWTLCCRLRAAALHARHKDRYRNVDDVDRDNGADNDPPNREHKGAASASSFDAGFLKTMILSIVAVSLFLELLCWALIAGIYTKGYCDEIYLWSTRVTYGAGFGLGLTAWLMELVAIVVFALAV